MTGNYNIPDRETTPDFKDLDENIIFTPEHVNILSEEVLQGVYDLVDDVIFDYDRNVFDNNLECVVLKELILQKLVKKLSGK